MLSLLPDYQALARDENYDSKAKDPQQSKQSEHLHHLVKMPPALREPEVVGAEGQCPTPPTTNLQRNNMEVPARGRHAVHGARLELDQHIRMIGPTLTSETFYEYSESAVPLKHDSRLENYTFDGGTHPPQP